MEKILAIGNLVVHFSSLFKSSVIFQICGMPHILDAYASQGTTDKVVIKYQNCDTYSDLLQQFTKNLAKEKIVGHTIAGPHKDDILFLINNKPAAKTVSRGEGKILLLTIFIILIKKYSVRYVIFDDLFNEIDIKKIHKIEKLLEGIPNVFITDCRLTELDISSNIIKL